jgi:glycosyltransferase involved in cell wall biosynthesis
LNPAVSVVLGVHNGARQLPQTIESVLGQSLGDFEFIIVNDGSSEPEVAIALQQYVAADARVRIVEKRPSGLTAALIDGCRLATGRFIARIDNGDRMTRERLATQSSILDRFGDCVLVSCRTGFHGPEWEELWSTDSVPMTEPVDPLPADPGRGLNVDISHHGSVMFRKATYLDVGGYRPEFYFGQDWDLWYRLAEQGRFFVVPEVLYHARIFPGALSMIAAPHQQRVAALSLAALQARREGRSEAPFLSAAAEVRPTVRRGSPESGFYFIGEALRRKNDPACRRYLGAAIRARPWSPRAWLRLLQSAGIRTKAEARPPCRERA